MQTIDCRRELTCHARFSNAAQTNEMRTVLAGRKPNAKLRTREYLTEAEAERVRERRNSGRR
jgi:hypothetical protein